VRIRFLGIMIMYLAGCAGAGILNNTHLGGYLIKDQTLYSRIDEDFPSVWHTCIYVLNAKNFNTQYKREKKMIYGYKDGIEVFIKLSNPIINTTDIKIKVLNNGKVDLEQASYILNAIHRELCNPSRIFED